MKIENQSKKTVARKKRLEARKKWLRLAGSQVSYSQFIYENWFWTEYVQVCFSELR